MSEYLEISEASQDVNIIKSYRYPYIAVDTKGEVYYSPKIDGIMLSEAGRQEYRIDEKTTIKFALPPYITEGSILFKPDEDEQPEPIVSGYSGGFDLVVRDGKTAYDMGLYLLLDRRTVDLYEFTVEFLSPGQLIINVTTDIYQLLDDCRLIEYEKEYLINSAEKLLLLRNDLRTNQSCYFTWISDSPATLYLFDNIFVDLGVQYATSSINLEPGVPVQCYSDITNFQWFVQNAKLVSDSEGVFKTSFAAGPPKNNAVMLEYNKQVAVNDSEQLFAITKLWNKAFKFILDGEAVVEISDDPNFDTTLATATINTRYTRTENGNYYVEYTKNDLSALLGWIDEDYLYIRFTSETPITVTPQLWDVSENLNNTRVIVPNSQFAVAKGGNTTYRLKYTDIEGYDLKVVWASNYKMKTYISDICPFAMIQTNSNILYYKSFARKGTGSIAADTVLSWKDRVDADGYIYARFNPSSSGRVTLQISTPDTTEAQVEE